MAGYENVVKKKEDDKNVRIGWQTHDSVCHVMAFVDFGQGRRNHILHSLTEGKNLTAVSSVKEWRMENGEWRIHDFSPVHQVAQRPR
jgi:hypothetical protein